MKLYRGSIYKTDTILPQPVHSDDLHKFKNGGIPEEVVWADSNKCVALAHALLQEYPFSRYTAYNDKGEPLSSRIKTSIPIEELLKSELDETVYIYELDNKGFTPVQGKDTTEYYSTEPCIPINTEIFSKMEILNMLKEAGTKFESEFE